MKPSERDASALNSTEPPKSVSFQPKLRNGPKAKKPKFPPMPSISEVPANSTSVWIVSDSFADTEQFRISSLAADLHCSKFVLMKSLDTQLATLLT